MKVIFLCTGNSARSQMAEGFARHLKSSVWEVHSAGTRPVGINPYAIEVMSERGIDISGQRSKSLEDIPATADLMVTLCSTAAQECVHYTGARQLLHWNLTDPASAEGDEETIRAAFRRVRDDIEARLHQLVDEIGSVSR